MKELKDMSLEELREEQRIACGSPITVLGDASDGDFELAAFDELTRRYRELEEWLKHHEKAEPEGWHKLRKENVALKQIILELESQLDELS